MSTSSRGRALESLALGVIRRGIRDGSLTIHWPEGGSETITRGRPGPKVEIHVRDRKALRRIASSGGNGMADAYLLGEFDCDDLASLVELAAIHMEPEHLSWLPDPVIRTAQAVWRKIGRTEETRGPLKDIVHHYDLGNDFYAEWLDPSMTYSSAIFESPETTLEEAQLAKYRRLAEACDIRPGQRILEIGSGWGGFARFAASELDVDVTTVTVSREQALWVSKLAAEHGLGDRIQVQLEDFLMTRGTFDRIVSIEMIESIPGSRWPEFFDTLKARLSPGGRVGLQAITIADHHWEVSASNPDFVRRYIFPGGQIPAPKRLRELARERGMTWTDNFQFGSSYARTLAAWRDNFDAAWPSISAMGFDDDFKRLWRYYLSYCEGGFRSGRIDVGQIVLEVP